MDNNKDFSEIEAELDKINISEQELKDFDSQDVNELIIPREEGSKPLLSIEELDKTAEERKKLREIHSEYIKQIKDLKEYRIYIKEKIKELNAKPELDNDEQNTLSGLLETLGEINGKISSLTHDKEMAWKYLKGMSTFAEIKLQKAMLKAKDPDAKQLISNARKENNQYKEKKKTQTKQAPSPEVKPQEEQTTPKISQHESPVEKANSEMPQFNPTTVWQPRIPGKAQPEPLKEESKGQPKAPQETPQIQPITVIPEEKSLMPKRSKLAIQNEAILNEAMTNGSLVCEVKGTQFRYMKPIIDKNGNISQFQYTTEDLTKNKYGLFNFTIDPLRAYKVALREKLREVEKIRIFEGQETNLKAIKKKLIQEFKDDLKNEHYDKCAEKMIAIRTADTKEQLNTVFNENKFTYPPENYKLYGITCNPNELIFPPHLNKNYNKKLEFNKGYTVDINPAKNNKSTPKEFDNLRKRKIRISRKNFVPQKNKSIDDERRKDNEKEI